MAARAHATARRARLARRGALVLAVGATTLGLQSLPSAAAAKDNASATSAPAAEPTAASTRRAERAAARAEAPAPAPAAVAAPAEAPPATPVPAPAHGHRGVPGPHAPAPASPLAAPLGAGAGPASHGADRPISAAHARRREERHTQATTTSPAVAAPEASEGASAANATALARGQKKAKKEKEKEKTKAKEKESRKEKEKKKTDPPPGEEATEESSRGATIKGKGVSLIELAQPTAVAAAVSAPSAPATPTSAGGTGTASISSLAATAKAQPGSGSVLGTRSARRAGKKPLQGTLASAAATSATPLVALQSSPSSSATQATAKRTHKSSSQPAIVKTITRLVGVVPTPIRILILALGALALALGVRSLLSGVRTRRLVRQRGELLEDVGALQAALLPVPPQRLGPVGTSVAYRPADGPGAGGDFYDVFALEDGRLAVIVGDVSGHGREALPHTALVRFTVRAYLEAGMAPGKALQTAGSVLERQLAGSFATVVVAIYHPRERTLTYASAGHPPPVVLGEERTADGTQAIAPVTSCSAPPIGAGTRTGTRETVVSLPGAARLCFHTDGVTEARIAGELFGSERLTEELAQLGPQDDASALLDRVAERSDARPDDMAACLLRVQDGAGAPAIVFEQLELDREAAANPRAERFLLDCGVPAAQATQLMRGARARLERADTVLLELRLGNGEPVVSLHDDNVIHPIALAAASAS
jgi:Stage II sporulation protein E (SpoIIE)